MGIVIRQSARSTLYAYTGVAIGAINLLWLFPLVLKSEEIGLIKLLVDVALLFTPFIQLGSAQAAIKFFPHFHGTNEQKRTFLNYLLTVPLLGFAVFLVAFITCKETILSLFAENAPLFIEFAIYLIPLTLFTSYIGILESYIRTHLKIAIPDLLKNVVLRIFTSLIITGYFFGWISFELLIVLYVGLYFFNLILLLTYLKYLAKVDFQFRFNLNLGRDPILKRVINFSLFMLLGVGGGIIVGRIDTIMTSYILGLPATGIYTIAFFMGTVIEMPRRSIGAITLPLVSKALAENNIEAVGILYRKTSLNQLIIGSWLLMLIWLNIDSIFSFIPNSDVYINGKYVVLFIGLSKLFDMALGINSQIITNSRYYRWNMILMPILAIIAIISNLIFIPLYGITGTAIATAMSILLYSVVRTLLVWNKFKLMPFTTNHMWVVLTAGLTCIVSGYLDHMYSPLLDILFRCLLITILYIGAVLIFKFSVDVTAIAQNVLNKISRK